VKNKLERLFLALYYNFYGRNLQTFLLSYS
jgi:hypothetical protein